MSTNSLFLTFLTSAEETSFQVLLDDLRKDIVDKFKDIGFSYIALDLEGYVSGSMNRVLKMV